MIGSPINAGYAKNSSGRTTILVDSVILIDHFNGIPAATQYLSKMHSKLAVSVITRIEVLTGFEGREKQLARRLLDYPSR